MPLRQASRCTPAGWHALFELTRHICDRVGGGGAGGVVVELLRKNAEQRRSERRQGGEQAQRHGHQVEGHLDGRTTLNGVESATPVI